LVLEVRFDAVSIFAPFFRREPECPDELKREPDQRVAAEIARVQELDPTEQIIMMDEVYKVYNKRLHAVRGITWAAEGGQVFGLLGANGAGKTTTFKMMVGQTAPSYGTVYIKGMDVQQELQKARSLIGYCPQFSSLLDLLDVREHLELYGRVKGLSGAALDAEVAEKLRTFDLTNFRDTRACQLSGGNSRKLCAAIAMVREPAVVLLDEPSAGMDPKARRFMWNVIQKIATSRKDSAVILTTHAMDEANALCSRVAIQCSGQIRCIGTPQQLKEWYGNGLELSVRLVEPPKGALDNLVEAWEQGRYATSATAADCQKLVNRFRAGRKFDKIPLKDTGDTIPFRAFGEWCLVQEMALGVDEFLEKHCGEGSVNRVETSANTLRYTLSGKCHNGGPLTYGQLFELFGEHSSSLKIVDYQISQGTLERTFNAIAAEDMLTWEEDAEMQKSSW